MRVRRKSRANRIVVFVLSVFCLLLIGVGAVLYLRGGETLPASLTGRYAQIEGLDPAAQTGVPPGAPKHERGPGEGGFGYRVDTALRFAADGTGEIHLQNPAFNRCLMAAELCVDSGPGVLYRSQYVAPNQYIESVQLMQPLSKGQHSGTIYVYAIDPESLRICGSFEQPVTIEVG